MSRLSLVLCALGVLLAGFLGRLPDGRSVRFAKMKQRREPPNAAR